MPSCVELPLHLLTLLVGCRTSLLVGDLLNRGLWDSLDLEWPHKWVILRITPTTLLSYHSCKKHIERDQLIDDAEPRKGVPQGRHVHGLLAGGAAILGEYFPDLFAALAQDGAVPLSTSDLRRYQLGVRVAAVPSPVKTLWQSRPFLEQHVRACLTARDNVQILGACEVTRLRTNDKRITGVFLRHRSGAQREDELAAKLVVDASGRGSRAQEWLAALGYSHVEETSVKIDVGYASRIYRCPDQLPTYWKVLFVFGTPPDDKRMGVIFPIQRGYWMVTLGGWLRDYPPDNDAGFNEELTIFSGKLRNPYCYPLFQNL